MNLESERTSSIKIDEGRWPIVRVTWPDITTDETLDHYMTWCIGRLGAGVRFAVVVDGRGALGMTRAQHARTAEVMSRHRDTLGRQLVVALVVGNALARSSLRAINALAPPPYPQRVFATVEEAARWAESELQRAPPT